MPCWFSQVRPHRRTMLKPYFPTVAITVGFAVYSVWTLIGPSKCQLSRRFTAPSISAAGAILHYLNETQKTGLEHIARLEPFRRGEALMLDEATRRGLELSRTLRDGRREGTLLGVLDETVTPMGARLLRDWVTSPLAARPEIECRLPVPVLFDSRRWGGGR